MNKKFLKPVVLLSLMLSLTSILTINAYAASTMTKEQYQTESTAIKEKIKDLNTQIKALRDENTTIRKKFQEIVKAYNKDKTLSITLDNFKKAQELKKSIPDQENNEEILEAETSVQTYVKNEDYDGALNKLNINYNAKIKKLEYLKTVNTIWKQINSLIS